MSNNNNNFIQQCYDKIESAIEQAHQITYVSNNSNDDNVKYYYLVYGESPDNRTKAIINHALTESIVPDEICYWWHTTMNRIIDAFKYLIWLTNNADFSLEIYQYANKTSENKIADISLEHGTKPDGEVVNLKCIHDSTGYRVEFLNLD